MKNYYNILGKYKDGKYYLVCVLAGERTQEEAEKALKEFDPKKYLRDYKDYSDYILDITDNQYLFWD